MAHRLLLDGRVSVRKFQDRQFSAAGSSPSALVRRRLAKKAA